VFLYDLYFLGCSYSVYLVLWIESSKVLKKKLKVHLHINQAQNFKWYKSFACKELVVAAFEPTQIQEKSLI
jgi:hypothetical protein